MSDYEEIMPTEEDIVGNRIRNFKREKMTDLQILKFYENKPKLLPIAKKILNIEDSDSDEEVQVNRSRAPIKKEPIKKEPIVKKSTISMDSFFNDNTTKKSDESDVYKKLAISAKEHEKKIKEEQDKKKAETKIYVNTKEDEKEAKKLIMKYKKEGKDKYEILDLFFFEHPILYNISNKILFNKLLNVSKMAKEAKELSAKITKENEEFEKERKKMEKMKKKKPLSLKKMTKEASELSRIIEEENEEWNKGRKEIKYLNVKPRKDKILKLTADILTDKTGKKMEIGTEFFTDNFTIKMLKDITNDILNKGREMIKQRKREGRMIKYNI